MNILVIGLNHKTAEVEVRERLAFNDSRLEEGLLKLHQLQGVREVVILSTCNRVEIYTEVEKPEETAAAIMTFLSEFHGIEKAAMERSLYTYMDTAAVRHVFRVASSLDSMVVGEPQILGQIKDAFDFSLRKKTTSMLLNRLMKKAISVAKRVRTETKISENAVSISFAAVELARKIFTDLSDMSFMLLGAGEMAELAAKHIMSFGIREIIVLNRTYDRGCELAAEFNGRAARFEDLLKEVAHTDIIICSTGAPSYVLRKEDMQKVMKERRQRPVFIIDISVPRNIDPEINSLDNVYLYDVDDLQGVVAANIQERNREAEKAEKIIEEEIEAFQRWVSSIDAIPAIVALREKAEAIKKDELERLIKRFPDLEEKEQKAIEHMASAIVNKLIHPPTIALKEDSEDKDMLIAAIKKLYGLNGGKE